MRTALFSTYGLVSLALIGACTPREDEGAMMADASPLQPGPATADASNDLDNGNDTPDSFAAAQLGADAGATDADAADGAADAAPGCPEYSGEIASPKEIGPGCVKITELEVTAKLTILPGTRVEFNAGGTLYTTSGGSIHALGTAEAPVTFTSAAETPAAGDWSCIHLDSYTGERSVFQNVIVEYGGSACKTAIDNPQVMLRVDALIDTIADTTFRHSAGNGVQLFALPRIFRANTFDDNAAPSLETEAEYMNNIQTPQTFTDTTDYVSALTGFVSNFGTATWRNLGVPWRFDSAFTIYKGEITIEPGTHFQLVGQGLKIANGTLNALGTAAAPIVWTSPFSPPAAGDWGCLDLDMTDSTLDHNVFEYAGSGCFGDTIALSLSYGETALSNLVFRNIAGQAIESWQHDELCEQAVAEQNWCSFTFENLSSASSITCRDDSMCGVQ